MVPAACRWHVVPARIPSDLSCILASSLRLSELSFSLFSFFFLRPSLYLLHTLFSPSRLALFIAIFVSRSSLFFSLSFCSLSLFSVDLLSSPCFLCCWSNSQSLRSSFSPSRLHRQPDHLLAFLLAELGTSGSLDSSNCLVIKGRYVPR